MGKVYINTTEIGTFEPQTVGTSGDVFVNGTNVGTFNFASETGDVYINGTDIGDFTVYPVVPPIVVPEYVIGLTYNAWVFKSTENKWYKDGIENPIGIPAHDIGIQWGLHKWSIIRREWV